MSRMTRAARSHASARTRLAARSRTVRLLLTLCALFAVVPATASAAVTRAVQAYDTPSFRTVWWPNALPAQVGDTVQWRFTQPGNPRAATHDLWLVPPGGTATQLGASYLGPTAQATVSQAGTYQFYCSIHGGLAPGGMNGTITVTTTDPGPPVDPGKPWETGEEPPDPNALINDTLAPTVFEEGDNTPPTLDLVKASPTDKGAKAKVTVAEMVTVTLRLKHGKKVVATESYQVNAGTQTLKVNLPKRLQDTAARYRLQVWATDAVDLDSTIAAAWIDFKP